MDHLDVRNLAATSLDINALLEFSRLLNESEDPSFIFNNLLLSLMGKMGIGRAAVALPVGGVFSCTRHAVGVPGTVPEPANRVMRRPRVDADHHPGPRAR